MKFATILGSLLLVLSAAQPVLADNDSDQQQKDFEQKQRIYGTKHPWENTAPYGTQYTPPQSGVGSSSESESEPEKKAAPPASATKHAPHKKTNKKTRSHQPVSTKHPAPAAK
jgi:hypothetical protein